MARLTAKLSRIHPAAINETTEKVRMTMLWRYVSSSVVGAAKASRGEMSKCPFAFTQA
jgi:hypothetical protein